MKTITYDFETFWSTEFSLSKGSFMEYIKSPEAEVISIAIKIGSGETNVYFGGEVGPAIRAIDWENCAAVAHNGNEFDHALLVWKYDVHPKLFVDTLALSKPKHQSEVGGSLAKLSKRYHLQDKDNTVLMNTKGRRLRDFTPAEIDDMREYNKGDVENCYALFKEFRSGSINETTSEELRWTVAVAKSAKRELALADMTARMIIYPQFVCNDTLLEETLVAAVAAKEATLRKVAVMLDCMTTDEVKTELASANKFAEILRSFDVEPPTKISKTTGMQTFAFAKSDEELLALLEHDNEEVQAIVGARLDVKSTLLETRIAKMLKCSEAMGGWMPVPLAYHSATTGRWGGRIWNPQNLPRINPKVAKLTDALRKSLCAPEGYQVVVSDLSGIELRVNHYLWEVESTAYLYDMDPEADLYKEFAAALFGIPVEAVTKDQRQLAKVAQLGLGFGAGWRTFKKVAKAMGGITLDDDEAQRVTTAWRNKYSAIVEGWRECQKAVKSMFRGTEMGVDPRSLCFTASDSVWLPSGRKLYYPGLHLEKDEMGKDQYMYGVGRNRSKVYAGLMDENLVQAIARDVIAEQALTVKQMTGYNPALMVHDELVYVIPEDRAQDHLNTLNAVMRTPPSWLPGIVLWSEGDIACNYGEAK